MAHATRAATSLEFKNICRRIIELSQPASSTLQWKFVKRGDSVRRFAEDEKEVLQKLHAEFSEEVLKSTGVLRRTADGEWQLSPVLAGEGREFVLLTSKQEGPWIDIVSDAGSLVSSSPPLFDAPLDWLTSQRTQNRRRILVFSGEGDFALARKLGLASSTVAGLDVMRGDKVTNLLQRKSQDPAQRLPIHHGDYEIVIVAFQLAKLDRQPPPTLQPLLQRLRHAESIMEVDTSDWLRILPAASGAMERISSVASFGSAKLVCQAVERMLRSTTSLEQYLNRGRPQSSQAYLRQRADLRFAAARLKQGTYVDALFKDKLESYSNQYAAHFVDPAIAAAVKDPDPARKGMWLAVSQLAVLSGERELMQVAGNPRRLEDPRVAREELQTILSHADGLVKLYRGLARTKPRAG